jgi:hypothetical protein
MGGKMATIIEYMGWGRIGGSATWEVFKELVVQKQIPTEQKTPNLRQAIAFLVSLYGLTQDHSKF